MKLYAGLLSLFTWKVRIALAEKGLEYETVVVPFSRRTWYVKPSELLAMNPKGQVPVLVDGDLTVYDSTIILEYLEDRWPEPPLYPRDPAARARCRQLEAAADEIFFPQVWELIDEVFRKSDPAARDAARVARATEALRRQYQDLERVLGGREYLCGEFGVADIGHFLTTTFATTLGAPVPPECPRLGAWYGRVGARPSAGECIAALTAAAQAA
jgi:glutathione S-transferase